MKTALYICLIAGAAAFTTPTMAEDARTLQSIQQKQLERRETRQRADDVPFLSDTKSFSEQEENIDRDIIQGTDIYYDKNGAAGRLGAESAGGLRGGVDLSINRQ